MACCGQGRGSSAPPNATSPTAATAGRAHVLFEHRGTGSLTLYGRATGVRYHFVGPGARVPVDPRDASVLELVKELDRVRE